MFTKIELREKALQIRSLLDMEQISKKIVASILSLEIYQCAKNILIFYPLKDEVNLLPLLSDENSQDKNFYLPKVKGDELLVCPYKVGDELTVSEFKTQEPTTEPINPEVLDMIFVPALMVGKDFNRIGYGKGFYDRFLSKNASHAVRIVPIPSLLVRDSLPADDLDSKIDVILDEA